MCWRVRQRRRRRGAATRLGQTADRERGVRPGAAQRASSSWRVHRPRAAVAPRSLTVLQQPEWSTQRCGGAGQHHQEGRRGGGHEKLTGVGVTHGEQASPLTQQQRAPVRSALGGGRGRGQKLSTARPSWRQLWGASTDTPAHQVQFRTWAGPSPDVEHACQENSQINGLIAAAAEPGGGLWLRACERELWHAAAASPAPGPLRATLPGIDTCTASSLSYLSYLCTRTAVRHRRRRPTAPCALPPTAGRPAQKRPRLRPKHTEPCTSMLCASLARVSHATHTQALPTARPAVLSERRTQIGLAYVSGGRCKRGWERRGAPAPTVGRRRLAAPSTPLPDSSHRPPQRIRQSQAAGDQDGAQQLGARGCRSLLQRRQLPRRPRPTALALASRSACCLPTTGRQQPHRADPQLRPAALQGAAAGARAAGAHPAGGALAKPGAAGLVLPAAARCQHCCQCSEPSAAPCMRWPRRA